MNKHTQILICAILVFTQAEAGLVQSAGAQNDFKILQSDMSGVLLEYTPQYRDPETIRVGGNEFTRYDVAKSIYPDDQTPGSPERKERSFLLRFPGTMNNLVEVLSADFQEIPNVVPLPVPRLLHGDAGLTPRYEMLTDAYQQAGYMPARVAELFGVGESRGEFLGELRICPIQYDASRHSIKKYTKIVVRVTFGSSMMPVKRLNTVPDIAINSNAFPTTQGVISERRLSGISNSVLASGAWYRFNITEDGIYKITGQMLMNAGVSSTTDPHSIRIFGNGGYELPLSPTVSFTDDLLENAIYIYDTGRADTLDASDYILFYGKGTRGWNYSPLTKTYSHYINHYSDQSVYWLTYGGIRAKQMAEISSDNSANPVEVGTVGQKLFREDEKINVFSSGTQWLGQSFNTGGQIVYVHSLPGVDVGQPLKYNIYFGYRYPGASQVSFYEHDSLIGRANGYSGDDYVDFTSSTFTVKPNFSTEESQLRISFAASNSGITGYLDWYELFYKSFLKAQGDIFRFMTDDTTMTARYTIHGFSGGEIFVFDVTKFDSVVRITNPVVTMDTCTFQTAQTAVAVRELYVVGPNGLKSPGQFTRVENQNIHGDPTEAEYLIITHSTFADAAARLQSYRAQATLNPLRTMVVDVDKIYNEFGGGTPSPIAIRNYLRYAYMNWSTPPRYVLLFGDGDFDYKRIMSESNPNWIPPWETPESFDEIGSYASDDYFGIFFSGNKVNLGIGRLTARSLQEANTMVDKIITYETSPVIDPWRLRFTFVADDGLAGAGDVSNGFMHTRDAEQIAQMVPEIFEKKKIYLYEYPTVYTVSGRRKPTVNAAIRNAINQGTMMLNFTGHGNPKLWTHEAVFVRDDDFPQLKNTSKYFFLVAATCNFSYFDEIADQSGGEVLAAMSDAGAIGVLSATRSVYADWNFDLNQTFYQYLLDTTSSGFIRQQRVGDILYRTKQIRNGENDRKYFLLGDPALTLAFPKLGASVDTINHRMNNDSITVKALERSSMYATVRDTLTNLPKPFSGRAQVLVYDANKTVTLVATDINATMTYTASGSVIFRGMDSVVHGAISSRFIIPKDISYSTNPGRIIVYFWNDTTDGAGYSRVYVNGTDSTAAVDNTGPQIQLYIDHRSFRPGDVVNASPKLIADIADASGVNTSTGSIGHRLEAWLDNQSESIDLSNYYNSKMDTYEEGVIEYPFGTLPSGTHTLRLRAWDTYNNPSTQETIFDVVTGGGLQLSRVVNYPNPFSQSTYFTFEQNQLSALEVEIKIYTVAGRMIRSLKHPNVTEKFVRIPWDGRDRDGDRVANGVYLYKIMAKTTDGRLSAESLGKLSVLK
jgi:hypothetical protein